MKTEDQWKKFSDDIKNNYLRIKNNRSTKSSFDHLLSLVAELSKRWPHHAEKMAKAQKVFEYHFHSAKPLEQTLEQLSQAVSNFSINCR